MKFLGQPYYVGLLSAAALHGAAHQQPMHTQVITDRPTRAVRAGRVRISFHVSRDVKALPVARIASEVGTIAVSTPEVTALDLVRFEAASGYMSNIATVVSELAERVDAARLAATARTYATPVLQRLGYLLELVHQAALAESVAGALHGRRLRRVRCHRPGYLVHT
jgi:predicted transcriptional regulator of viral defense system